MGEREPCRATAEIQIDRWRVWSRLFINLFKLPSKADALRGAIDFAEAQSLQVTTPTPLSCLPAAAISIAHFCAAISIADFFAQRIPAHADR